MDRGEDVTVLVEGGQHQYPYLGKVRVCDDAFRGGDAVHPWHADVHEHHIRPILPDQADAHFPIGGFGHDLDVTVALGELA